LTSATPNAVSASPPNAKGESASPYTTHAIRAVPGGITKNRLARRGTAPDQPQQHHAMI